MLFSIATAIGYYLFEKAASGIVGQVAYNVLAELYQKHHNKPLVSLYAQAFKRAIDAWKPSLSRIAEPGSTIQVDMPRFKELLQNPQLEISSLSTLNEVELAIMLSKNIEQVLILPGHQLTPYELGDLATSLIRYSAELLIEEIVRDENAFRFSVLQEARLAALDRQMITGLLEKIPITLSTQIKMLDYKIDAIMSKIEHIVITLDQQSVLGFTSIKDFKLACEQSVVQAIDSLPKYDAHLYVTREAIEWEFSQFLASESPCMLVQGEAGAGKTNVLCHLARMQSYKTPTLFFRGTTPISGRLGFSKIIADEIASLRKQSLDPARIIYLLNSFLTDQQSYMVIFIDAINEYRDLNALKESLGYAAQDLAGTRIKLCLSCRDVDWYLFEDEERLINYLYEARRSSGRINKGVFIEGFSDWEFGEAWKKYSKYYQLEGQLTPAIESVCRHPLMLQLLCVSFKGKSIPLGLHRKEIFDRYWKEKIHRRGGRALESSMYSLIERLYETKKTELNEIEVVKLIGTNLYTALLSEQVILYTFLDQTLDQNIVGFVYEAFLEYATARYLRQYWNWIGAKPETIVSNLRSLVLVAEEYRILPGVIQYLLLFLDNLSMATRFLVELSEQDVRWKIFFCDIQTKFNDLQLNDSLLTKLVELAKDPSPQVRWAAGNALGLVASSGNLTTEKYIKSLTTSEDWKEREVGAFAIGYNFKLLERSLEILERLANDINWRVRRAVGYTLNNLCIVHTAETFELLDKWSKSNLWRLRQAVAKSQKGLFINLSLSLNLLRRLSQDKNNEVRWLTVISLITFAWKVEIRSEVLSLLESLLHDSDYFVRKQIATLIPDLFQSVNDECSSIIIILRSDTSDEVRWELARALGRITKAPLAIESLNILSNDQNEGARFAALFSRYIIGDEEANRILLDEGESLNLQILREKVARAHYVTTVPKNTADIFSIWKGDRYASVIDAVIQETALLGTSELISDFFEFLLIDESEGIRWALASILSAHQFLESGQRFSILLRLIADSHYWVRREAVSSLQRLIPFLEFEASTQALLTLQNAIIDDNPEVRYAILDCLNTFHEIAHLPNNLLCICLTDEDPFVRELAIKASKHTRGK